MSYHYGNLHEEHEEHEEELSCEILDTSIYVSGEKMSDDDDDDSSQESYDYDWNDTSCIADCTTPLSPVVSDSHFDLTDPLRYFLELGAITPNEYDKWKIVDETPAVIANAATKPARRKPKPIDFGAGYNDTDDTDNTDNTDDTNNQKSKSYYCYGNGYVTQLPGRRIHPSSAFVYDPWFPNPDPTPKKQYTKLSTSARHMMRQFVVFGSDGEQPRLSHAFQLKLLWERYVLRSLVSNPQSLQDFWQTNALTIYEALQELVATLSKSKCFSPLSGGRKLIPDTPDTPEFHTTPVETLENTFETIGRMSRCIAEEFNTQPVVNYVEEFIRALYTELYFMALR